MASEVAGLDPLHGYFKHGNLVLRMRFPYLELAAKVEKFVERTAAVKTAPAPVVPPVSVATPKPEPVVVQSVVVQTPVAVTVEPISPKKPPVAVEIEHPKPAVKLNEPQHFFE